MVTTTLLLKDRKRPSSYISLTWPSQNQTECHLLVIPAPFVIPAQAGIQSIHQLLIRNFVVYWIPAQAGIQSIHQLLIRNFVVYWIPACAGMTNKFPG